MKNYRVKDLRKNLHRIGIQPLDVMVTGVTGAGKSSTLNTFFQNEVAKVGTGVNPETMGLTSYQLNDYFRFWDTPGLGDGVQKDQEHSHKMIDLMYKTYTDDNDVKYGFIDLVLVVLDGGVRDLGTTYKLLNEIVVPNFQKSRVLIAINQADMAMKGRQWDYALNKPKEKLLKFLDEKTVSIQRRVHEATGVEVIKPVFYSAEHGFNIDTLFDHLIDNMPDSKRSLKL